MQKTSWPYRVRYESSLKTSKEQLNTVLCFSLYFGNFFVSQRCAGEIAAVANEYCAVGVAYEARVSGDSY